VTNFSGKPLSSKTVNAACGGPQGGGMDSRRNDGAVAEASAQYLAQATDNATPASHDCPPGYKRTEVGVIPEDWEAIKMGDIAKIQRGASPRPIDSPIWFERNSTVGWLRISDVTKTRKYLTETTQSLSELGIANSRFVPKGNLVMSICATVGKPIITRKDLCIHDGFVVFNGLSANQEYIYYVLEELEDEWGKQGQTGSQMNLNTDLINGTYIAIPKAEKEQTAIANALSDVDALISELEKLIAKKQAIKTATMQQLLTGRTRLPQFALREDGIPTNSSGTNLHAGTGGPKGEGQDGLRNGYKQSELGEIPEDWEVKTYGEVFKFLSTSTNSRTDLSEDGDFGYIHYGDIHTKWNNRLDINEESVPRISKNMASSSFIMDGDLIMADASEDYEGIGKTVEVCNVGDKKLVAGLHTFLLRDRAKVLADGFRGYLHCIPAVKASFDRLATGMKVYGISKNNLSTVCIPVPSLEEQTAIATILSDMDEEIQALQQRLAKTRQIKQGMMQELLTGKTRLVKPEQAA